MKKPVAPKKPIKTENPPLKTNGINITLYKVGGIGSVKCIRDEDLINEAKTRHPLPFNEKIVECSTDRWSHLSECDIAKYILSEYEDYRFDVDKLNLLDMITIMDYMCEIDNCDSWSLECEGEGERDYAHLGIYAIINKSEEQYKKEYDAWTNRLKVYEQQRAEYDKQMVEYQKEKKLEKIKKLENELKNIGA
jgi:hypothetical protein